MFKLPEGNALFALATSELLWLACVLWAVGRFVAPVQAVGRKIAFPLERDAFEAITTKELIRAGAVEQWQGRSRWCNLVIAGGQADLVFADAEEQKNGQDRLKSPESKYQGRLHVFQLDDVPICPLVIFASLDSASP